MLPSCYIVFGFAFISVFVSNNTIIFLFVLDTSECHLSRGFRCICFLDTSGLSFKMSFRCIEKPWEHHIYIGIQFSRPLTMYLTATYIGETHIRRIPMCPTMTRAGKDYDGDSLGRGLLLMINFPRGNSFPTENTSAQLIPSTKQYLCTQVMYGITGTSVSSPQQITP